MAGLHATIGVLSALNHRHATGEGQHVEVNLLASALSGLVNQTSAFVAGGVVPFRMGNSHPSLFPYEPLPCADGELIVTAGNDGQFRRLVRGARRARAGRRPAVRPQRGPHGQPRRAAAAARRAAAHPAQAGLVPRHHRRGRAVRADQHHRPGRGLRRGGRPGSGGDRGGGGGRHAVGAQPDHLLRDRGREYRLPPPTLDEHGDGDPPLAGRTGRAMSHERPGVPDVARRLEPRRDHGCSAQDLAARPDGDRSASASWRSGWRPSAGRRPAETRVFEAVLAALADHGFTPTAIVDPAHLPVGAGLAAGRAGRRAARRRLPVPRRDRGLRPVPARGPRRRGR